MFRHPAEQLLGELCSELALRSVDEIITRGLHEYLDELQTKMNQVGHGIFETFFAVKAPVPTKRKHFQMTLTYRPALIGFPLLLRESERDFNPRSSEVGTFSSVAGGALVGALRACVSLPRQGRNVTAQADKPGDFGLENYPALEGRTAFVAVGSC